MKAAEILRKLADIVDSAEQGDGVDQLGRSQGSDGGDPMDSDTMSRMDPVPEPEQDTGDDDAMMPPLQQKHELLKKVAGVDSEYDDEEGCGSGDLDQMKKMAGIMIGGEENDIV